MAKLVCAKCLMAVAFLVCFSGSLLADLADENDGESVEVRIELINTDSFQGYDFYMVHPVYVDFWGSESDSMEIVDLDGGAIGSTGGYGYRSPIYARDQAGNVFQSLETVGGNVTEDYVDFAYYVRQIEILEVKNGLVKFRTVARVIMDEWDQVISIKKGSVVDFSGRNWLIALLPAVCLLALVAFYLLRGKAIPGKAPKPVRCPESLGFKL